MIDKNTLIVGIAIMGALALLSGTLIPVALAITDPNQRSTGNAGVVGKDNDSKGFNDQSDNFSPVRHSAGFNEQSNCFLAQPC